jgi:hypothetical protein
MMSLCRRALRVVLLLVSALVPALATACGRRDRTPPDRPSQPTLTVMPDPNAPTTGRRVVAVGQIAQAWHVGAWSPASITLSDVAAGDAIVVLGVYWVDLTAGPDIAPTDDRGTLRDAVTQGPAVVGKKKPPVVAQLYVELDAAAGPHTIVPPYLGGPAGDGTLYVVQVRGLTEHRLIATGQRWAQSEALPSVSVALDGAAEPGDLIIAFGGYDNTEPRDQPGFGHPPPGWLPLGVLNDARNNVPSELRHRAAPDAGAQPVTWTWTDPKVNVAAAAIAALR